MTPDDEILKELKKKYYNKDDGWESGYVGDYILEAIALADKRAKAEFEKKLLRFIEDHENDGESKSYCFYALIVKFIQEEFKQSLIKIGEKEKKE